MERGPSASQASKPRGILGRLFGRVMAFMNEGINQKTVALLRVQSTDQVLEIGFGSGTAIKKIASVTREGFVAGIDVSEGMVAQAQARNRQEVLQGRVELQQASASEIPYPDRRFDKACAMNTFQFWSRPAEDLKEVCRVLKPGGLFILSVRGRVSASVWSFNRKGFSDDQLQNTKELL
jgi:ubiquinone/menaquinone biosynthesis C-methylase UbiE